MRSLISPSRWLCLFAVGLFALAGCEKDEIRSYTVKRPTPETVEAKVRLLAAILENGPQQWFFKLAGPVDAVSKHAQGFSDFVQSVRFTGKADAPIEWKTPDSWEKGPAGNLRYATFYLEGKGKPPELTVFKFDQASSLLDNVARWCRLDLGRKPPRNETELAEFTKKFHAGDNKGVLIDMTGPGPKGGKAGPMAGMGPAPAAPARRPKPLPLTYTVPAGWEETGPRSVMGITILTSFRITEGDRKAEVQVTPLPILGGGLLANVNRWRGQVGLGKITQEQLDKDPPRTIRVSGESAPYYDFAGPDRRMLLVTAKHGNQMWYLKMIGDAGLVGKNKNAFTSFVQSVKFTGAADE